MLTIFTRAVIIYIFLLIAVRLMGKKQLGELQPFEFAITLIVAELACIPMSDSTVPITFGLVPIFTLFVMHLLLTKAVKHSIRLRKIVNGRPVIIITEDGIDYKSMSQLDMTIHDLLEALRGQGFFSPAEIAYAIIETNGSLTAMPKAQFKPLSVGDMALSVQQGKIPYTLICEGKLLGNNLKKCMVSEFQLKKILDKYGYRQSEILLLSICGNSDVYIQAKNQVAIATTMKTFGFCIEGEQQ